MQIVLTLAFVAVIGYLLGSLNSSLLVGMIYGVDVRKHGSGNAGATNTLRTLGKKAAVFATIGDALKGVVACLIGNTIVSLIGIDVSIENIGLMIAGMGAIVGHNWPIYFGFKGGKGVLTSMAVVVMMDPILSLALLVIFVLVVAITRYVSLGAILTSIAFPMIAIFIGKKIEFVIFAVLISMLIVYRHRANISRIIHGKESKLGHKKELQTEK